MARINLSAISSTFVGVFLLFALLLLLVMPDATSAQDRGIRRNPEAQTEINANEKRVALVIGNGSYETSPLKNPPNDAKAMGAALRGLGFEVSEKVNLGERDMRYAIDDFGDKIRKGGVGLFFYAGHGVQVNGKNYMIPIGAKIKGEGDVEYEAVEIGRVLGKMTDARNRMNIIIIDACRDNPYARSFRSSSLGLAFVNAPSGTLIAYATAPGSVAHDGTGKNGLYTSELIRQIHEPGLRIEDVFKRVRSAVQDATGGKQVPWEHSSIVGDFYFKLTDGTAMIEKPKPPGSLKTGLLRVETNPPGATVAVEGKGIKQNGLSPFSIGDLTPGKLTVRVTLEQYETREREVEIVAGRDTDVSFTLDRVAASGTPLLKPQTTSQTELPSRGTGSLWVNTNPTGAAVFVDGLKKGVSPVMISGIASGEAIVRVVLSDYEPQDKIIEIIAGKEVQASFLLEGEVQRRKVSLRNIVLDPSTPSEAEALWKQAEEAFKAGNSQSAIALWEGIIRTYRFHAIAAKSHHTIGNIYLEQGQAEKALEYFDHLIYAYPGWDGIGLAKLDRLRALSMVGKKKMR